MRQLGRYVYMKLIGYVRVSSKDQRDNTSLEDQKKRIENYCNAFGYELIRVYEEVGSGKDTENRPVFQEAMNAIGEVDGIIAIKLDRIARNTRDVLELVEDKLQPKDKALILIDLNVDTSTPTGKMILTVMASVAQLERDQINERCRNGRNAKRERGEYIGGKTRYGYDLVGDKLVPNPKEQAVIRLILRRIKGYSMNAVAQYLTQKGIPTKEGGTWTHVHIKKILDREQKTA
jgi:site-specific DNA recombinase